MKAYACWSCTPLLRAHSNSPTSEHPPASIPPPSIDKPIMPLLGLFSRPLLLDSTPTPSSFVPDQSTPSPNKALLPPHLRGPNPDDAAAVQTAPIDEGYEEKGVLSWLTPFTTPRPKNKSAGAEWVSHRERGREGEEEGGR